MKEEWRKIEKYPNYSVSNFGRIRNDTPCVSCKRINKDPAYNVDYYEYDEKKEGE